MDAPTDIFTIFHPGLLGQRINRHLNYIVPTPRNAGYGDFESGLVPSIGLSVRPNTGRMSPPLMEVGRAARGKGNRKSRVGKKTQTKKTATKLKTSGKKAVGGRKGPVARKGTIKQEEEDVGEEEEVEEEETAEKRRFPFTKRTAKKKGKETPRKEGTAVESKIWKGALKSPGKKTRSEVEQEGKEKEAPQDPQQPQNNPVQTEETRSLEEIYCSQIANPMSKLSRNAPYKDTFPGNLNRVKYGRIKKRTCPRPSRAWYEDSVGILIDVVGETMGIFVGLGVMVWGTKRFGGSDPTKYLWPVPQAAEWWRGLEDWPIARMSIVVVGAEVVRGVCAGFDNERWYEGKPQIR